MQNVTSSKLDKVESNTNDSSPTNESNISSQTKSEGEKQEDANIEDQEVNKYLQELEYDTVKAKEIIEDFVKREFGKGLKIDDQSAEVIRKGHERAGRALTRLSKELYTNETHFVLELVQNADDNKYTCETPTLEFVIKSNKIEIHNNEVGFSPVNILALCDIGKSTKPKNLAGFIGKKGIGFKSVFSITDAPEIHSCGFHVRLDISKEESYGYPLPEYVDSVLNEDHEYNEEDDDDEEEIEIEGTQKEPKKEDLISWNTKIILPLKSTYKEKSQMKTLTSKFKKIEPSLLLFLHRLQRIAVKDTVNQSFKVMTKTELTSDIIQVQSSENQYSNKTFTKVVIN